MLVEVYSAISSPCVCDHANVRVYGHSCAYGDGDDDDRAYDDAIDAELFSCL